MSDGRWKVECPECHTVFYLNPKIPEKPPSSLHHCLAIIALLMFVFFVIYVLISL
jgi:hypothetical protein